MLRFRMLKNHLQTISVNNVANIFPPLFLITLLLAFHFHYLEQLVAGPYLGGNLERHAGTFLRGGYRVGVVVYLVYGDVHHACRGTGYEHLVADGELAGLTLELGYSELGEILDSAAHVHLAFGGV